MRDFFGDEKYKKIVIAFALTLVLASVTFAVIFIAYNQKLKNNSKQIGSVTGNTADNIVSNDKVNTSLASTTDDKTIENALNETLENIEVTPLDEEKETETPVVAESKEEKQEDKKEEKKPVSFSVPVSGEIITDYAEDNLIYSKTLQEWTTHLGIDIKADKSSVVIAAEAGTIKTIKNDPRYGLSITIAHDENFETVYSNLLSSEFVKEGDKVEKGQTIGTVGESASFEVAEVPHLHFEMYKDGVSVNPTIYMK